MSRSKLPFKELEYFTEYLKYNPDTGEFIWIKSPSRNIKPGSIAGSNVDGYRQIRLKRKSYSAHRLAWYFYYGTDPGEDHVDHENRDPQDNRISNLRLADDSQNCHNTRPNSKGIRKLPSGNWQAKIKHKQKTLHIGTFECPLLAHLAYVNKKRELAGEFACV